VHRKPLIIKNGDNAKKKGHALVAVAGTNKENKPENQQTNQEGIQRVGSLNQQVLICFGIFR